MAREIIVAWKGEESRFQFAKLDREKLYGRKRRVPLDQQGQPCQRASLTRDGSLLIQSGMTNQGYFDGKGVALEQSGLVGLDKSKNLLPRLPSTLGVPQPLDEATPEALLDLSLSSVYMLDGVEVGSRVKAALEAGSIFRFPFAYMAGFKRDAGFLLHNAEGFFAIVGQPITPVWCEPAAVPEAFTEESIDDELDFDMF